MDVYGIWVVEEECLMNIHAAVLFDMVNKTELKMLHIFSSGLIGVGRFSLYVKGGVP